ncbi:MAG: CpsD/CapB family tyrosine-protein kinase [Planctomycetes bacterium]|nr:CpsD/CapB family tyrosine-protein kinase [Planctomycetota bacterium]
MKKVWEEAAAADAAVAADPTTPMSEPAAGADEALSGFIVPDVLDEMDSSPLDDDPLSEVLRPAAADAPAHYATDPETVEWDPRDIDPAIVSFHDHASAICEQYRSIRARLFTMNRTKAPQVVMITSSVPQEGKSVSTLNLGIMMAGGGEQNILIADADLRRTSIARMLGIDMRTKKGLAEVFAGEAAIEDVILPTPYPNLKVIPAGHARPKTHAELMGSSTAHQVMDEFRKSFDYTFVDTPPVTTVSDVNMLAPHCDGVIMVIEMRRTPEPTVQAAVRSLQTNNVKILGCILARYREERTGYYDRYYRYYRND